MAIIEQLKTLPETADVQGLDLSGLLLSLILQNDVTTLTALRALAVKIEDIAFWDSVLADVPAVHGGNWEKFTVDYATDLTAAADNQAVSLITLPANTAIDTVYVKHSAQFAGPGLTSMTVKVGVSGDTEKYAPAFDVWQAASNTAKLSSNVYDVEPASVDLEALFEGNGGSDFSTLTGGSCDIYVKHSALP